MTSSLHKSLLHTISDPRCQSCLAQYNCPDGWDKLPDGDRCYHLFNEKKNWNDAEHVCQGQHGGHLAAVTNQEIHDYINRKGKAVWVGGTDEQHEGGWSWSDCSDWKFTKWRGFTPHIDLTIFSLQQPNGGRGENCLILRYNNHNEWHDFNCNEHRHFVCSIRLCPPAGMEKLSLQ